MADRAQRRRPHADHPAGHRVPAASARTGLNRRGLTRQSPRYTSRSHQRGGGGMADALVSGASDHNNPGFLPYVISMDQTAAGFIFGYPLRAGHPTDRANKVLWVVRFPRNGSPLNISGQLSGANAPAVHVTQLADSGPGEIYPSIVDVPQPGCWRFDLTWSTHQATVYLEYQ